MLKQERLSTIEALVNERKYVSIHELMAKTNSSESTIRADIIELSELGKIQRLRGGAQALDNDSLSYELSMEAKLVLEPEAKMAIAQYAASLVKNHSIIYVDAGSSTYFLSDILNTPDLEVMTNSFSIARCLASKGHRVYMTGGELKMSTDAFIGTFTKEILSKFTFDLGFFGCNGIDLKKGLTTPDFEEAMIKKMAMEQCKKVYCLADHTKFGAVSAVSFHPFNPTEIITDYIDKEEFKNLGIKEVKP